VKHILIVKGNPHNKCI